MTAKLRGGYKQTEIGVIPEDWKFTSLGEMCIKIGSGITPRGGASTYKSSGHPFVRSQNVGWGKLLTDDIVFIDNITHESFSSTELQLNDVLLNITGASIGRSAVVDGQVVCGNVNQHVCVVRPKSDLLDPRYLNSFLISNAGQKQIESFQAGGNREGLNFGQIKSFQLPLPSTFEQRAIAKALSDVDALSSSQDALITKKRDIKQAAMQQLLTGKQRLPGFNEEWKIKTLGGVVHIKKGQLITEKTILPGAIPVIAGGKAPAYFHNQANRKGKTITISASGANAGFVAFFEVPIFASDCSTISEGEHYSIEFIYSYLQLMQQTIYKSQTGGAQPHVQPSHLNPLEINLPSLQEQTAIAKVLSDMDAEISALESERDKTKLLKQGMMQELLTGRTRLV